MTLQQIADIIAADTKVKISELHFVQKLADLTNVSFKRAVTGYQKMREQGLINEIIQRDTIGMIDVLILNDKIMTVIEAFDSIPVNASINKPIISNRKPSSYAPDEIIPGVKMSLNEISNWLCYNPQTDTDMVQPKNVHPW